MGLLTRPSVGCTAEDKNLPQHLASMIAADGLGADARGDGHGRCLSNVHCSNLLTACQLDSTHNISPRPPATAPCSPEVASVSMSHNMTYTAAYKLLHQTSCSHTSIMSLKHSIDTDEGGNIERACSRPPGMLLLLWLVLQGLTQSQDANHERQGWPELTEHS